MAPIFEEAMDRAFNNWTTLALAVEQGWGGRDSAAKRQLLQQEVMDYLAAGSRRRRPWSHENKDDVENLANYLYTRLDELFNVETDDNSDHEVAHLCLHLYNSCRSGDLSFAESFLKTCGPKPVDLSRCQGVERTVYDTEEDELLDRMGGMDIDPDGVAASDAGSSSSLADADEVMSESGPLSGGLAAAASTQAFGIDAAAAPPARVREQPAVDDEGFVSVVRGKRR